MPPKNRVLRGVPTVTPPDDRSSVVTTFRLRQTDVDSVLRSLPGIPGLTSHHLIARKLVRDFASGRLVYLTRRDQRASRLD